MSNQSLWFIAGLVLLIVLGSAAPKLAGGLVILVVTVLAIRLARKQSI